MPLYLMLLFNYSCDDEPYELGGSSGIDAPIDIGTDDDLPDDEVEDASWLVNVWSLAGLDLRDATVAATFVGQPISSPVTGHGSDLSYLLTFDEYGGFTSSGDFTLNIQSSFLGQDYDGQIPVSAEDFLSSGGYLLEGGVIYLSVGEETVGAQVVSHDDENLFLEVAIDWVEVIDGIEVHITGTAVLHFNRI